MAAYIITYDLSMPGRSYNQLYDRIKSFGTWAAITESSWLIVTEANSVNIRDHLSPTIDRNDKLLVGGPIEEAAWIGLTDDIAEWLMRNI